VHERQLEARSDDLQDHGVLVTSGEEEDARILSVAAKLAGRFSARVVVVPAYPDAAADYVNYGTALASDSTREEALARIRVGERESQDRLETLARDIAKQEGLTSPGGDVGPSISVRARDLDPATGLAPIAALADLVIFGASAARDGFLLGDLFAQTLLTIRAPVLLVKGDQFAIGPVAIAWDGSVQAARAVRAALPFLKAASGVLVLSNIDDVDTELADDGPVRDFLRQHEVANVTSRKVHGANIADSLLAAARADKCTLLVAGGFGRPRLVEFVLGGTTRALVNAAGEPHLLLAH
jgi:nucleotide-binding universal stress UspA family protein